MNVRCKRVMSRLRSAASLSGMMLRMLGWHRFLRFDSWDSLLLATYSLAIFYTPLLFEEIVDMIGPARCTYVPAE